jgi:hypothetical protein
MNLCFLLCFLLFVWRKSTIIKYSPNYARGSFRRELKVWGESGVKNPASESNESQGSKVEGKLGVGRHKPFPMNPARAWVKVPSTASWGVLVPSQVGVQLPKSPFCIQVKGAGCGMVKEIWRHGKSLYCTYCIHVLKIFKNF